MKTKTKIKLSVILILTVAFFVRLNAKAVYFVTNAAEAEFLSYASVAFYKQAGEILQEANFADVLEISYDKEGNVSFILADEVKIGLTCKTLAEKTFERFDEFVNEGVTVPLGAFSGIRLLSGVGREVNIKTFTVTSVVCDFLSESEELGINQTRWRYYLVLKPEYTFLTALSQKHGSSEMRYLLYDVLIIGKVPQIYFASK